MSNIRWYKVGFSLEKDEFTRVAADFSPPGDRKILAENIKSIQNYFTKSNLTTLDSMMWRKLENTDSWNTKTLKDIEKAIKGNYKSSGNRSIENVLKEFVSGKVRAPVVMKYNKNQLTLIGGNTRLMVARVLDISPKVSLLSTDW